MLIMSRRQGQTILIGEQIEIVIADIGRSRVRVGIRAPRQMLVIAREQKLVRDENLAAAAGAFTTDISALIAHLQPMDQKFQAGGSYFSKEGRKD